MDLTSKRHRDEDTISQPETVSKKVRLNNDPNPSKTAKEYELPIENYQTEKMSLHNITSILQLVFGGDRIGFSDQSYSNRNFYKRLWTKLNIINTDLHKLMRKFIGRHYKLSLSAVQLTEDQEFKHDWEEIYIGMYSANQNNLDIIGLKLLEITKMTFVISRYAITVEKILYFRENTYRNLKKLEIRTQTELFDVSSCPPGLEILELRGDEAHLDNHLISDVPLRRLPRNLTHLYLRSFDGEQDLTGLPEGLTHFSTETNDDIANKLPKTLIELHLDGDWTGEMRDLPPHVTHLNLGSVFARPVNDVLPKCITHLEIGDSFNESVDRLPNTLEWLRLGYEFNQPVDHLPPRLTYLYLDTMFNHPVDNLPPYIKKLIIGDTFNHPIDNLPKDLSYLFIGDQFNMAIDKLPIKLMSLCLGKMFNRSIDKLPASLIRLVLNKRFNCPVYNLPPGLKSLTLDKDFDQSIDRLPSQLRFLSLNGNFNQSIAKLPRTLITLVLNCQYNHILPDDLPNLHHVTFGDHFIQSIKPLPNSVRCINLGNHYDMHLSHHSLPKDLTHIRLGRGFTKYILLSHRSALQEIRIHPDSKLAERMNTEYHPSDGIVVYRAYLFGAPEESLIYTEYAPSWVFV